jgi:uncharacterized protein YqeY
LIIENLEISDSLPSIAEFLIGKNQKLRYPNEIELKGCIMTFIEKINQGIKEAMRSRDQLRLDTLRMLKSKILTVDARGNLSDSEVLKLFKTYFGNLQEALEHAQAANRPEIVEKLKNELDIIQEFLPKALSLEETKRIVMQAIADSEAKTKKDLGLVMKNIMKLNPSVDGKLAKDLAGQLLAD